MSTAQRSHSSESELRNAGEPDQFPSQPVQSAACSCGIRRSLVGCGRSLVNLEQIDDSENIGPCGPPTDRRGGSSTPLDLLDLLSTFRRKGPSFDGPLDGPCGRKKVVKKIEVPGALLINPLDDHSAAALLTSFPRTWRTRRSQTCRHSQGIACAAVLLRKSNHRQTDKHRRMDCRADSPSHARIPFAHPMASQYAPS